MQLIFSAIIPLIIILSLSSIKIGGVDKTRLLTESSSFFDKKYTDAIKGLAAIIVIYVHFHTENGNKLQEAIGSFAFVCVTFFFLVSAFGMQLSVERKSDYLKNFWRNRLVNLLVPMLLVNLVVIILTFIWSNEMLWHRVYYIDKYVQVLLEYCILFWLVEKIGDKINIQRSIRYVIILCGVTISSLAYYFIAYSDVSANAGWCFERMGLVWGLLLYIYFPLLVEWMGKNKKIKLAVFCVLALVVGIAYLKFKHEYFWGEYLIKITLGLVILLFLFIATGRMRIGNKLTLFLGSISYEIYLIHGFVMSSFNRFISVPSGVFILFTVLCSILLAFVIHSIGKPIVNKLRR